MKKPVFPALAFFCGVLLFAEGTGLRAGTETPAVYVADFSTRAREITPLSGKLTDDFEVALGGTGKYQLLERRSLDRLREHALNEAAATDIGGLPAELLNALKLRKADMVVFGEVFDDIDSGQVSLTVSFVTFSGEKRLLLNTKIPRGKVNDADTRATAMEELVKKIVTSSRKVMQLELNGVLFQIARCRGVDRVVTVELVVTNNEDDKILRLYSSESFMFDNRGNQTKASSGRLANLVDNNSLSIDLISAVPVRGGLEFQGVSATAETIARLDIRAKESTRDTWFTVSFRNIPIER